MYRPAHFVESDLAVQHALIHEHPLGLLISNGPERILANPIPFLLFGDEGERGVLRCHLSRANPQWQALRDSPAALVVFQGADAYITPSWYPSKAEHGKVVPTWNYAIVQARGTARIVEDAEWLLANVTALSARHEGRRAAPWHVSDAPDAFVASQLRGIVGIEIPIAAIEGKIKASQNRPEPDREGVVAGLTAEDTASARAMAELVEQRRRT